MPRQFLSGHFLQRGMKKLLLLVIPVVLATALYAKDASGKVDISVERVRMDAGKLIVTLSVVNPTYIPLYADRIYVGAIYQGKTFASTYIGDATYVPVQSSVLVDASIDLSLQNVWLSLVQLLQGGTREIDITGWANLGPATIPFSTKFNFDVASSSQA